MSYAAQSTIRRFFRSDPNIVVLLPVQGNSRLRDISGGNRHAVAQNSPGSGPCSLTRAATYAFANQRGVAPRHIHVAGSSVINWPAGSALSMIFWMMLDKSIADSGENNYRFLEKSAYSNGGASGNFNIGTNNWSIGFAYTNSANSATYSCNQTSGPGLKVGVWSMVAITYSFPTSSNATKPRIYVNGFEVTVGSWNGTPNGTVITNTAEPLQIASDSYSESYPSDNRGVNGKFAEVAFWKGRILSPAEIAHYYRFARNSYRLERVGYPMVPPPAAPVGVTAASGNQKNTIAWAWSV